MSWLENYNLFMWYMTFNNHYSAFCWFLTIENKMKWSRLFICCSDFVSIFVYYVIRKKQGTHIKVSKRAKFARKLFIHFSSFPGNKFVHCSIIILHFWPQHFHFDAKSSNLWWIDELSPFQSNQTWISDRTNTFRLS